MDDRYHLSPDDFGERFHKIVFGAVDYLGRHGAGKLDAIAIDDFLSKYPSQYKVFQANDGVTYIEKACSLTSTDNFNYYYNRLKKFALLNKLSEKGFDVSPYWNPEAVHVDEIQQIQDRLESSTAEDIIASYELPLSEMKTEFCSESDSQGVQAGKGMAELYQTYKEAPDIGLPLNSKKLSTIFRGRRLKKLYIKSLPTAFGKTRISVADACLCAIPTIYDSKTREWVSTGFQEPTLVISTELEVSEIQSMVLAYVSCVDEMRITDGVCTPEEEERIMKAVEIIEQSPLQIHFLGNYDTDDVENIIRSYKLKYNIKYVFFDYVATSLKMISSMSRKTRGVSMREDLMLLLMVTRLKDVCNSLNISIDTSTQVNGSWKDITDGEADQNVIRGAKSIADKADVGIVILPPSKKDIAACDSIIGSAGYKFLPMPNQVVHIYKLRRGQKGLSHVKVFLYFDYGTLRTTDLFVVDKDYKLVEVENLNIERWVDENTTPDEEEPAEAYDIGSDGMVTEVLPEEVVSPAEVKPEQTQGFMQQVAQAGEDETLPVWVDF